LLQLPPMIQDTTEHRIVHFLPARIDLAALDDPLASLPSSSGPTPTCRTSHTFATAIALYLHAKFDQQQQQQQCRWRRRQHEEQPSLHSNPPTTPKEAADDPQWTLVMDVRPGHGWPNPPAVKMLGFIREAGQMLFELFPGRLHRCIVFPVPVVAAGVWGAAKKVLDPTVASRVVVVSGPAEIDSPVPVAKLMPYVSRENLQIMEEARLAAFAE
jgi:CRAL/TRIO domain